MTETEARDLLRYCDGQGGLEAWIAGRRWKTVPGGWSVTGELQGCRFQLELGGTGLWISTAASGGCAPATWVVEALGSAGQHKGAR